MSSRRIFLKAVNMNHTYPTPNPMDDPTKNITIVRKHYSHWSRHSGINQFIKYLNINKFRIKEKTVPIRHNIFYKLLSSFFLNILKKDKGDSSQYSLNDLAAEISVFTSSIYFKTDIVHILDAEHSLMFLSQWFNKYRARINMPKIIAMFHQPPSILDSLINPGIVMEIDHVIVLSPEQVTYFEQFLPSQKISMILHGIDVEYFKPGVVPEDKKKFMCLGGGNWLRDYSSFIKTARILKSYPDIEFHIISSKTEAPLDLQKVFVHKNIPDDEMLKLYQTSDVLFMPLEDSTANNVLLEGIACGLPVVSTDLTAVREYLPGKEAFLVEGNSPDKFAEILLSLYHNPKKIREASGSARTRAVELSWPTIAEKYGEIYLDLG